MASGEIVDAKKILKVGLCVDILIAQGDEYQSYSSRIEDIEKPYLYLAMPMDKGYPIIPYQGSAFHARLVDQNAAYRFKSIFRDKAAKPIPVWKIDMPETVEKFQQREYVRVEVLLAAEIQVEDEENNLLDPQSVYIRDISGGGAQISSKKPLNDNTKFTLTFELPQMGMLRIYCESVRCRQVTVGIYWIGVKFVGLSDKLQMQLIRFIFNRQRELLKKQR